ncbi:MAG: RDD family protein [Mycobacterium sp.]|nr:RDD family protein [Mycobacterium sp.]
MIDTLIEGVFCAIVVALGVVLANASAHTVIDQNGQPSSEASTLGLVGFFLAVAIGASGPMLYEWLMLAYRGATLGKMALGIRVVNQSTGQNLGHGPAFLRQLVPSAAGLFCFLLTLLVYFSPLFDTSGRLQGWHDRVANDLVIKVR